jgi:hypothetical protein
MPEIMANEKGQPPEPAVTDVPFRVVDVCVSELGVRCCRGKQQNNES